MKHSPSELHRRGIAAMPKLLSYWLDKSSLGHRQFIEIASWGLGQRGFIEKTSLCRAMNGKLSHGCSLKALRALGAANYAIFLWHKGGSKKAINEYGGLSYWGIEQASLEGAIWLPLPGQPVSPLLFQNFCEIQMGLIELPYLDGTSYSARI